MKLTAICNNHFLAGGEKEIKSISVWIGNKCTHSVTSDSLSALLRDASESNRMQIYDNPGLDYDGQIDAYKDTPLYTNGQFDVRCIKDESGQIIWGKNIVRKMEVLT